MDKYPKYISEERQELFERYLLGQMTVEERGSFETKMIEDQGLQNEFDTFKALFHTVEEAGMRAKLQEFHQNMDEDGVPVRQLNGPERKFNFRIAATVLLLLSVGGFWFFNRADPNERLFDDYYTQDPGLPTVMGSNDNYEFYEAMVDYKQGHYDIAIEKWGKLLEKKPTNDTLNYFMGSAHLGNRSTNTATPFFENTIQTKGTHFEMEAYYYLGLIHLKSGNRKKAIDFLESSDLKKAKELSQTLLQNQ